MNSATITLYNALKKAGVDDETAHTVSADVITRDEAKHFSTKADISELKSTLIMWMVGLHLTTIGLVVALVTLLVK